MYPIHSARNARREAARTTALALSLWLAPVIAATTAWADTTIVADATLSGMPEGAAGRVPATRTITFYIKGTHTRTESMTTGSSGSDANASSAAAHRRVTVYDRAAGKIYLIDDEARTYSVLSLKEVLEQEPTLPERARGKVSIKSDLKMDEAKGADAAVTIADQKAKEYTLQGSIKIEPKMSGLLGAAGGLGRRRRSGAGGAGAGRSLPEADIEGTVAAIPLSDLIPDAGSGKTDIKEALLPFVREIFPGRTTFRPLLDRLSDRKVVPLRSSIQITRSGGNNTSSAATPFTAGLQTHSVSNAPLDDKLFTVPSGYRQVDPPADARGEGNLSALFGRAQSGTTGDPSNAPL